MRRQHFLVRCQDAALQKKKGNWIFQDTNNACKWQNHEHSDALRGAHSLRGAHAQRHRFSEAWCVVPADFFHSQSFQPGCARAAHLQEHCVGTF
jgi:hypothetical protein